MGSFIPLEVRKLRFYLDRLVKSLKASGSQPTEALARHAALAAQNDAPVIESADIHFWRNVKTAIEYVVDFMSFDATPKLHDAKVLEEAYRDLMIVIEYVELVFNEHWEPEFMGSPWA